MLTIEKVKEKLDLQKLNLPVLVIDKSVIRKKYKQFTTMLPGVQVYYAVKTNPHIEVLKTLKEIGSGFEISSEAELDILIGLGVPADKIITGNTLKTVEMIKKAFAYGVTYFAVDSTFEIDKLAEHAPGSIVSLRVIVDNTDSEWPLSRKFGVGPSAALDLLKYAKEKGLQPKGLTFHVGSQCLNPAAWANALVVMSEIYKKAKNKGFELSIINMGGGYPAQSTKPVPELEEIKKIIKKTLEEYFPDNHIQYMIEPGKGIVGDAGLMVASVIARANRGVEKWVSLNVGVYQGLFDSLHGVRWNIISDKELTGVNHKDQMAKFKVGGPTCDSLDTLGQHVYFPKDINLGDIVFITNIGAYSYILSTGFNGFKGPEVIVIE